MSKGISSSYIKNIFIISISCLTFAFFILNTSKGKNLTYKIKTNLLPRTLQENQQPQQKETKICEKTSTKLKEYFETGDKTILGLEEDNTEKYDAYYIEALINIVKYYYQKKEKKQETNTRLLGNEDTDDEISNGYIKYLLKYAYHILPLLVCLGIGILSLPGWAVCCCCVCCKCKCCVCKVPKCKTPSIVLALISYVIVALISFYALVEQNKLFSGLADIECSVLRFTDNVLEGETNKFPPFWAGIGEISNILREFKVKTEELQGNGVVNVLNNKKGISDGKKDTFENQLSAGSNIIYTHPNYQKNYRGKDYQLDIAKMFGKYDKNTGTTTAENSVCQLWLNEYGKITTGAAENMAKVDTSFNAIFTGSSVSDFDESLTKMDEIKTEFNSLKNLISDQIMAKADNIDKIGNLVYTLFFTLLMVFCAAIVVFMLLLCCCSGELCTNLSCFQCFCKFFLHFFWNLMALIMFILFMGGCLFTISGTLGDDLVNVVSFLTSEDNLGADKNTIILGNVKQYLNQCFNHEGKILSELQLSDDDMEYFENLKSAQLELEELKNQFNDKLYKFVYSEYKEELEQRIDYNTEELELVSKNDENISPIKFVSLLNTINNYADTSNKNENWDITSTSPNTCDTTNKDEGEHQNKIIYHPKKCYPTIKTWSSDSDLTDAKNKLNSFKEIIDKAKSNDASSINTILNDLGDKYQEFLESEIETLGFYIDKISTLTDLSKNYTSEDDELFSFMNCKFIKDNVDVILYYLKHSFQNDIYEIGVYLLIASFAMPFGISFTILLIMIANDEIETNKEKESKEKEKERRKSLGGVPPPATIEEVKLDKNEGDNTEQRPLNNRINNLNNPN